MRMLGSRVAFMERERKSGESIVEFVDALRSSAVDCQFGNAMEERVRDQLIFGIGSVDWQSEICRRHPSKDATLTDVMDTAVELEKSDTSAGDTGDTGHVENLVNLAIGSADGKHDCTEGGTKHEPQIEQDHISWLQSPGRQRGAHLRFMTFNIWNSGSNVENGLAKIAKHISYMNPDIVALQEVDSWYVLQELVRLLGPDWSYAGRNQTRPDTGILTRHAIVGPSPPDDASVRSKVRIQFLDGSSCTVNFWSVHLDYHDYGPYAACNRLVTSGYQIEAGEQYIGGSVPGRVQNILTTTGLPEFKADLGKSNDELMVVAGDMNCPSHLDWIASTKSNHCEWVYEWPVTKTIIDHGLVDSFREIYPDPAAVPANTWSTVQKSQDGWGGTIPEPQDRIDMIFYKSARWSPVAAKVYAGNEPLNPKPNHFYNDWPSDHYSVVVDFKAKS